MAGRDAPRLSPLVRSGSGGFWRRAASPADAALDEVGPGARRRRRRSFTPPAPSGRPATPDEVEDLLERVPIFRALARKNRDRLVARLGILDVAAGEALVEEGDRNRGRLYVLLEGDVVVCKQAYSEVEGAEIEVEIVKCERLEVIGDTSLIDQKPAVATIRAKQPSRVALVDLSDTRGDADGKALRNAMTQFLAADLSAQLRRTKTVRADTLKKQHEITRIQQGIGSFLIAALTILSFYTLSLSLVPALNAFFDANFILTPIIITVFTCAYLFLILTSPLRNAFFGLRLDNWPRAMAESLFFSGLFILGCIGAKLLLMEYDPRFEGVELWASARITYQGEVTDDPRVAFVAFLIYAIFSPAQELVARSGVQAPLYAFLHGSTFKRGLIAILVSNLVFAAAHAHTNFTFALISFIPGLFWGWLFLRTNSLLAVSVSHVLVGSVAIFVLGLDEVIRIIAPTGEALAEGFDR